jgi:hypothetical protein
MTVKAVTHSHREYPTNKEKRDEDFDDLGEAPF